MTITKSVMSCRVGSLLGIQFQCRLLPFFAIASAQLAALSLFHFLSQLDWNPF